jgi:hypothetical protein
MLSQSVRSKRIEKPMSAIAGHAYCGRHNDYHKGGKMPERRAGFGRAGLTPVAVSAANRWNACGKEALVGKGALQGPAPRVKFSRREPAAA